MSDTRTKPDVIEARIVMSSAEPVCEIRAHGKIAHLPIESLTTRGAQREITQWAQAQGYRVKNRWTATHLKGVTSRTFVLSAPEPRPASIVELDMTVETPN